jgi:hypothetical protein
MGVLDLIDGMQRADRVDPQPQKMRWVEVQIEVSPNIHSHSSGEYARLPDSRRDASLPSQFSIMSRTPRSPA